MKLYLQGLAEHDQKALNKGPGGVSSGRMAPFFPRRGAGQAAQRVLQEKKVTEGGDRVFEEYWKGRKKEPPPKEKFWSW